jgi:hypothetical protein
VAASSNDTSCFRLLLWLFRASQSNIDYVYTIYNLFRKNRKPNGSHPRELRRQVFPASKLEPMLRAGKDRTPSDSPMV